MNYEKTLLNGLLLGSLSWLVGAADARAETIDECGGIFVTHDSHCEYRKKQDCSTDCKTETVETACTTQIYQSCQGGCTETAQTSCEADCSDSCTQECDTQTTTANPDNCMDLCVGDCQSTCEDGGQGENGGCCLHTCQEHCQDQCGAEPPSVTKTTDCESTCTDACNGSCTAQANVQCQIDCQSKTFEQCQSDTVQTCQTRCNDDGGAIFCDGQFVDTRSAKECASKLKEKFNFNLDIAGAADTVADATTDTAHEVKHKTQALCSLTQVDMDQASFGGFGLFTCAAGVLGLKRIRRRK